MVRRRKQAAGVKVSKLARLFFFLIFGFLVLLLLGRVLAAQDPAQAKDFSSVIDELYLAALAVAAALAVLMIAWAGLQYAGGSVDPTQVKEAKETIVYAIGGLLVLILGKMILDTLWGLLSQFRPPAP